MENESKVLCDILLKYELITKEKLDEALKMHQEGEKPLAEILIESDLIKEDDLFWALGNRLELPFITLDETMIDVELFSLFPEKFLISKDFLPIVKFGNELTICTTDPTDKDMLTEIERTSQCRLNVSICSYTELRKVKERVIAKWQGKEIGYERVLSNFYSTIPEYTINNLLKDETMTNLILFIFDEIIKNNCDSITIVKSAYELRLFFNYRGLRNLKMRIPSGHWGILKEKLSELVRLSGNDRVILSRDINYEFIVDFLSDNTITLRNLHKLYKINDLSSLGLTQEQKVIIDNVIPFRRGLCIFSSKDKLLARKLAYNLVQFYDKRSSLVLKLDDSVLLEGFDNIIELSSSKDFIKTGDYDILIADEDLIDMRDVVHVLEQGKMVFLLSHTFSSFEFIDFIYSQDSYFTRILPYFKLFITSSIIPKLCNSCKEEVNFSMIPKEIFSFYKDIVFFRSKGCDECGDSGYSGFKEFNEVIYIDENILKLMKEITASEEIFKTLKSGGFLGIREKLMELAKNGEIPYFFLV